MAISQLLSTGPRATLHLIDPLLLAWPLAEGNRHHVRDLEYVVEDLRSKGFLLPAFLARVLGGAVGVHCRYQKNQLLQCHVEAIAAADLVICCQLPTVGWPEELVPLLQLAFSRGKSVLFLVPPGEAPPAFSSCSAAVVTYPFNLLPECLVSQVLRWAASRVLERPNRFAGSLRKLR